jgi:DNA-binding response OmpR family regulator
MTHVRILLVEDDRSIASSVVEGLEAASFTVTHVSSGADALAADEHDLILLDLGLPDMDGRDVCRELRQRTKAPIIMLTARSEEFDRVLGLELGADDYVTKPFSLRELVARIRAVARRTVDNSLPDEPVQAQAIGPLRLDRRTRRVHLDGTEVQLTAKEFDLFAFLASDIGAVRTRTEILENVWDAHWYGPTKTVDAHVASLRKKLGAHEWIQAVRGVGFRLEPPE